jgi:hypothetical protein
MACAAPRAGHSPPGQVLLKLTPSVHHEQYSLCLPSALYYSNETATRWQRSVCSNRGGSNAIRVRELWFFIPTSATTLQSPIPNHQPSHYPTVPTGRSQRLRHILLVLARALLYIGQETKLFSMMSCLSFDYGSNNYFMDTPTYSTPKFLIINDIIVLTSFS